MVAASDHSIHIRYSADTRRTQRDCTGKGARNPVSLYIKINEKSGKKVHCHTLLSGERISRVTKQEKGGSILFTDTAEN